MVRTQEQMAWELYKDRGCILPEYRNEIAERKKIVREWAEYGQPICD